MNKDNVELMVNTPVPKAILRLAIPTVLSMIVSLIYNLTDTYFIGLLDDPVQLGAVSLAFPVFMVIQAVGNIFGNGAPAYISRCLGEGREEESRRTSAVSIYASVFVTLIMTAVCLLFMEPILHILGASEATADPTRAYLRIIVGFSFVMTLQIILPALLRSEGQVKQAVVGMVIGTALNIILDPIFILVLHQGAAGAAWATIIGNLFGVVYYLILFFKEKTALSIKLKDFKPSRQIFREVLKIGLPNSISQIIMSFSNIILNNLAVGYGDYVISAYGVAGKLISMVFMITVGYVSGYMPFAGYNYGAKKMKRMLSALKFTIFSGTVLCLILLIPFLWFAPAFVKAFTSDTQIIEVGVAFLRAYAWVVPFMALQMAMMCTFQATGSAVCAMMVNLGRQCLFTIPFLYLFHHLWGLTGLMYAQTGADMCTTLLGVLIGIPLLRRLHRMALSE
ncbi:MAG: MATE family efflux transporter [Firmicutes bacterium]|nr:MATE family efflux transporter [Bacillota bacterium]